ncbi:uncharacterized protein [Dysidea avara]|uniref:uncharacterized protein n=1 Tax=Dysidea avara TaxID=196820 RepID=UPI003331B6DE
MQPCFTQRIQQRELCYGHERESITRLACKKLVRAVPFDVILGDNIDNGHVFLGFTASGTHLISYKCVVEEDGYALLHHYSLHWWKFTIGKLLQHEHEEALFATASISSLLLISVYQPVESKWVLVLGSNPIQVDNSDPHYLTLVQLPCKEGSSHSVHCFYEVLPPFTSIDPLLVLKIPGVVILNSMCSLTAIRYDCTDNGTDNEHKNIAQCSTGCGLRKQIFSTLSNSSEPRLDQFSILPLHVYREGQELFEVCSHLEDNESAVAIEQCTLDIEQWLSNCVESLLSSEQNFQLSRLVDYDVQLVEVDAKGIAIAAVVPLLAVLDQQIGRIQFICLELIISWRIFEGAVELISQSPPTVINKRPPIGNWKGAQKLINSLKHSTNVPSPVTVYTCSNQKLVNTGRSVYAIKHQFLPIYIVYRPRNPNESEN